MTKREWLKFAASRAAILVSGFLVVLSVFVVIAEDSFIYFPERYPAGLWSKPRNVEDCEFTASDGVKLHAWFGRVESPRWTVLVLHGNAGNITYRTPMFDFFSKVPADVMLLSYRGYGKSEGKPSEEGFYADARAAYDFLTTVKGVDPKRLALFGESIGAAVAFELALHVPIGAVISQSGFTSIKDMCGQVIPVLPVYLIMRNTYASIGKAPKLTMPKLFVHGRADEIVPFEQGERLFAAAAEPKESCFIDGAHHNDVFEVGGNAYAERVAGFLNQWTR